MSTVRVRVFSAVSTITGHSVEDLDEGMFLESDLGMDSLKIVEFMNSILDGIPVERREAFHTEVPMSSLMQMQTLGEVVRVLGEWGGPRPETAPAEAVALETTVTEPSPPSEIESPATADTVEILHSQYPFLVSHWAVSTCSLCSRVRLQGPFDTAAAQRTWQGLLDRHPALRARFSYPPEARSFKDYRMEVLKTALAPAIAVHDLRSLPPADQAEALTIEMRRCVSHEWALDQWPLHRFFSWRMADDVHELFFTNHHLVADGLSNQQIVREFVELYRADATGDQARLPAPTAVQRYQEVAAAINAWDDPEASRALAEFLHRQGKEPFFWNPLKRPRASTARIQAEHARIQLDAKTTGALLRRVGEWRLPMNSLLVGAFLRAVGNLDPTLKEAIVNVPTSGRLYPGVDASEIVGCFAQNLALSFTLPAADETWLPFLHRVHAEIEAAIAAGYDRAQTREAAVATRERLPLVQGRIAGPLTQMIRASLKSNLFFPYIGQTRIESRYGPISVLDYQAATITNVGTIDTLAEVFHEQLMMTVNYDAELHSREFINRLSETFVSELRHLADCQDTFGPAARNERDCPDHRLVATQLRQVAEEVLHLPITVQDMNRDLESELGVDSLERIRIITRIQSFFKPVDRRALFAARSLNEMIAACAGRPAETAVAKRSASPAAAVVPATPTVETPVAEQGEIPLLRIIEQCRRSPQAIAVECGQERLSYQELHRCSNRLAHCLRAQGVGRGALVGIMLDRGPHLLIAILGTLKAGAAYVPLDPDYPSERIGYMLGHARLSTVLTEQRQAEALAKCVSTSSISPTVIRLDDGDGLPPTAAGRWLTASEWRAFPDSDPVVVNAPDDLMVVLYTSGSTGKPKGVMLAHRGYANRLDWMQSLLGLRPGERVAQKTSVCFDISVWELLWPLMIGGTVCPVATDTVRDPWALSEWVRNRRINVMHFVPSLFGEFLSAACEPSTSFPDLRSLVFSGEALPASHIQRWMDRFGTRVGLVNLYGPTEASIDVTAHVIRDRPGSANARIPIGQAMPNVHLRILDAEMRPWPPGEVGELWIGGIQLAHGYLNDPDRTHEAFKANPFGDVPGATLYRTGDLAAQLPDGSFDYHGRIDSQVKIRGFRVELGEVEAALSACPGVSEAAVLAIEYAEGQKRLIAALAGQTAEPKGLRGHLARTLPDYMIPHRFVWLPRLPKNQNGKLDRAALHQVLTEQTHVSEENRVAADEDRPVLAARGYPLGPAQRWLTTYFTPPYRWAGYTRFRYLQPLDMETFNAALKHVTERHPALRAVFFEHEGQRRQRVVDLSDATVVAEFYDGTALDSERREALARRLLSERAQALAIDRWPLWSVLVIKEGQARYDIAVIGHHMVSDLISNGILFKDLWRVYGLLLGESRVSASTPVSYLDYLDHLGRLSTPEALTAYCDYWQRAFPSAADRFEVPFDHARGENIESSAGRERFVLSKDRCEHVERAKKRYGCSLYPLLLAPLYRTLGEWAGSDRVVVSHRSHGRDLGNGTSYLESVGNFAVNYPLGLRTHADEPWGETVRGIQRGLEAVPLHGVSFDLVADRLPAHLYPDTHLTPVRVNYLGNRSIATNPVFEFDKDDWDQRYAPPDQRRTTLIEVFLSVADGALQVEVEYSRHFHTAATIEHLGRRYLDLFETLLRDANENVPKAAERVEAEVVDLEIRRTAGRGRSLSGKVAIVTGAGRGIGRAIARAFASEGARVALISRSPAQLEEAVAEVRAIHPEAVGIAADVTSEEEVRHAVDEVLSRFGAIDILVNNAGINVSSLLAESDPAEWRSIIDVNLLGTYYCCRAVLPHLQTRGAGKIVNLGSAASVIGYPLFSAYSAAKHAVLGMTKALAEEVKQANIQVNAVCPSFVDTRMTPAAFRGNAIPTREIAEIVLFLCSPQSDSITGESINVFGRQDMYSYGSERLSLIRSITKDFRPGLRQ